MNLSDTFYVALCMTVLILGVVYWFWTQNQYIQRKLNLLENIVYEMKTTLNAQASAPDAVDAVLSAGPDVLGPATSDAPSMATDNEQKYPPPPGSELGEDEDLLHEELHNEINEVVAESLPSGDLPAYTEMAESTHTDLQPGGVGSGVSDVPSDVSAKTTVLDGMTRAELKRLAEQKGITVKNTMTKQALIDAIRAVPITSPFEAHEATISLN